MADAGSYAGAYTYSQRHNRSEYHDALIARDASSAGACFPVLCHLSSNPSPVSSRFFSDEPIAYNPGAGAETRLAGSEAHHLIHVMRAKVGDHVTLFDGSGAQFGCEITAVGRADATLAVHSRDEVDREAAVTVTVGVALPKGDRQKNLIEKLTEVGVARVTPLLTEHSVAAPKGSAIDKLRRLVIEASKQCGRNRLMVIDEPLPLAAFLAAQADADERLFAHPGGDPAPPPKPSSRSVAIAIGPEGGFSDAEAAAASREGWRAVSLGPRILRVETAAIVVAASRADSSESD